jgi:hypothetical protein
VLDLIGEHGSEGEEKIREMSAICRREHIQRQVQNTLLVLDRLLDFEDQVRRVDIERESLAPGIILDKDLPVAATARRCSTRCRVDPFWMV